MGACNCHVTDCSDGDPETSTKRKEINMDPVDKHTRRSRRRDISNNSIQINPISTNTPHGGAHHAVRSTFDLDAGVADMLSKIQIQTPMLPDNAAMLSPVQGPVSAPGAPDFPETVPPSFEGPGTLNRATSHPLTQLKQHHSNTITKDRAKEWDDRELMNLETEMTQEMQALVRSQSMTGVHSLLKAQPVHGSVHSVSATIPGVAYFPDRHHVIMETVEMETGPGGSQGVGPMLSTPGHGQLSQSTQLTQGLLSKDSTPGFVSEGSEMDDSEMEEMRQQMRRLSTLSSHSNARQVV